MPGNDDCKIIGIRGGKTMSDFIENEGPDMALNLDALSLVSDGGKTPSGGTVLHFPDKCPQCGAALIKKRGASTIRCLECGAEIEGTP